MKKVIIFIANYTSFVHEIHNKEQCINALIMAQAEGNRNLSVDGIASLWLG